MRAIWRAFGRDAGLEADAIAAAHREAQLGSLALPRFLDVSKPLTLSHAEISALYFVVEDYFESAIADADPEDPVDEARELAQLLRGVIARWNSAHPHAIAADLIELPWEE